MIERDLRTGDPEDRLGEYGDDAIAEMIDGFTHQAEHYRRLAFGARGELLARLLERGATVFDGVEWTGKVKPGTIRHHVENVELLFQCLAPFLSTKDLEGAFIQPPTPAIQVNHTALNQLYKRGGDIARAIDAQRVSVRGDSTLELERKPEVQGDEYL